MKALNSKWKTILIAALTFIAYANTLNHGFVLDDDIVILKNQYVQEGLSGVPDIFSHGFLYGFNQFNDQSYRPLVLSFNAVIHTFFGDSARAYHFFTVLLYALCCALLYKFLSKLFKSYSIDLAFYMSLIFVLHPIHTEVVANVKSLDEIIYAIMALLSLTSFWNYFETKSSRQLWIALIFFFLALLSKETALSLFIILPLCIWTFTTINLRQLIISSSYLIIPVALYLLIRSLVLDTLTFGEDMSIINNGLAAAGNMQEQLATNFYIFSEYVKLLFYPHPLSWDYSYPHFQIVDFSNNRVILTLTLLIASMAFAVWGILKRNVFAFCLWFFLAAFALTSNFFILIGATLGERFLFFPSIAWAIAIVYGLYLVPSLFPVLKSKTKNTKVLNLASILICVLFFTKTYSRNEDWKTPKSLFEAGAKVNPNSARVQSSLAAAYRISAEQSQVPQQRINMYKKAEEHYLKSLNLLEENSSAWYNLGVVYMSMSNQTKAKKAFERAIQIDSTDVNALNNLGVIYFQNADYNKAIEYFNQCLKYNSSFQSAYANMGAAYHQLGDYYNATQNYKEALRLNPNDQTSMRNLEQLP